MTTSREQMRIFQAMRTGVYEPHRKDFTQWLLEEGRSNTWVAARTGFSRAKVSVVARTLGIDTAERRQDAKMKSSRQRVMSRVPPTTLAGWHQDEVAFQRMRLSYAAQWDRGW